MPKIRFEDISFSYKQKNKQQIDVFKNFNFTFESGRITAIMGESGCGKTTMLRLISGLEDPDQGQIYFDDDDYTFVETKNRKLGYVSQNLTNYPHLNAFKNIALPLQIKGCDSDEIRNRVYEIAEKMKIDRFLSFKPKHLSLGQNQRVAIARALVKKPELYLFDEMFSNIDKSTKQEILYDLKKYLNESKTTAIYVTHDADEALLIADTLIIIEKGKVIFSGVPNDALLSKKPEVSIYFKK